jgi:hypothetical protein
LKALGASVHTSTGSVRTEIEGVDGSADSARTGFSIPVHYPAPSWKESGLERVFTAWSIRSYFDKPNRSVFFNPFTLRHPEPVEVVMIGKTAKRVNSATHFIACGFLTGKRSKNAGAPLPRGIVKSSESPHSRTLLTFFLRQDTLRKTS